MLYVYHILYHHEPYVFIYIYIYYNIHHYIPHFHSERREVARLRALVDFEEQLGLPRSQLASINAWAKRVASIMYTTGGICVNHLTYLQCTCEQPTPCIPMFSRPHPIPSSTWHRTTLTRGIQGSLTPWGLDMQKARNSPWPGLKSMMKSSAWGRQELRRSQLRF